MLELVKGWLLSYCNCDKWKKLYEDEHEKYIQLKEWTENLISSNKELMDKLK